VHFLVFLPNATQQTLEHDCKLSGLTDLRGGEDVLPAVSGPDGQTGIMLGWTSPTSPHMHYDAGKQDWLPSLLKDDAGKSRYWIGVWRDSPPKESELRRNYTQAGARTQFGAEKWKLPKPDTVDSRAVSADDGSMPWEGRNPLEFGAAIIVEAAQRYRDGVDFGKDEFLGGGTRTASWSTLQTPGDCAVPDSPASRPCRTHSPPQTSRRTAISERSSP